MFSYNGAPSLCFSNFYTYNVGRSGAVAQPVTVNATIMGLISTRGNELFNILISCSGIKIKRGVELGYSIRSGSSECREHSSLH